MPAGRKIVIYDIKHLAINAFLQSGESNRLCTVVNVRQRYRIGTTDMQKYTEGIDAYAICKVPFAGTVHGPGPHDDVRNPKRPTILAHELFLFDFGKTISIA